MGTRETLKAIHDRGDLLPWLNGEAEIFNCHEEPLESPDFNFWDQSAFTFRPIPKPAPPVLRPWTWDELWEKRDCWFRTPSGQRSRLMGINRVSEIKRIYLGSGDRWTLDEMLEHLEYLAADGQTWLPCGVLEPATTP